MISRNRDVEENDAGKNTPPCPSHCCSYCNLNFVYATVCVCVCGDVLRKENVQVESISVWFDLVSIKCGILTKLPFKKIK